MIDIYKKFFSLNENNIKSFYILIIQVLVVIFGLLITVFLSRKFGLEVFGQYSLLISTATVSSVFISLGVNVLVIRDAAIFKERADWASILGLLIFVLLTLAVGFFILIFLKSLFLNLAEYLNLNKIEVTKKLLTIVLLISILNLTAAFLRAFGSVVKAALTESLLFPVIFLGIIFFNYFQKYILISKDDLHYLIMTAFGVTAFLGLIILFFNIKNHQPQYAINFKIREWSQLQKLVNIKERAWSIMFFAPLAISGVINDHLGLLILGYVSDLKEVANLKIAMQFSILITFWFNINISIYARELAVFHAKNDVYNLEKIVQRIRNTGLIWAIFIFFILLMFGSKILSYTVGLQSSVSVILPTLIILAIGQVFNVAYGPVVWLLNMTGHEAIVSKTFLISVSINLLFCSLIAPIYGALGVAICTSLVLLLWNIYLSKYCEKHLMVITYLKWRNI